MDVVVAGGHGRIGRRLLALLVARGDTGRGLVRDPGQLGDLERLGARAILADLEHEEVVEHVAGADAVVFAAGAGPGSGAERKRSMDLGGAVRLIEAAAAQGVRRYLMVSSMGAAEPAAGPEAMRPYLEAKAEADARLAESGLDFTIVRPGLLTDDAGTGLIAVGSPGLSRSGQVPRDDVAATLLACLDAPGTTGVTFELLAGETPIEEAVRAL